MDIVYLSALLTFFSSLKSLKGFYGQGNDARTGSSVAQGSETLLAASQIPPLAFPLVFPAPWRRTEALRRKTYWRGFAPPDLYPVPWDCLVTETKA